PNQREQGGQDLGAVHLGGFRNSSARAASISSAESGDSGVAVWARGRVGGTLTGRGGHGAGGDPGLLGVIGGSLASIEKEVETAIGRTARSPMIRDAHDYRAGIHDRLLRKLTGRSYSSLVHPIVRDFPAETMRPGDVFFHNDVYSSEGGIGHLP